MKEKINLYVSGKFVAECKPTTLPEAPKPMLLSQELMEIGRTANPKSNLSQGEASSKMHKRLQKAAEEQSHTPKQLYNITSLVCDKLNAEGFKYYKVSVFFESTEGGHK